MQENRVTNTDYFPLLAVIADEKNEISADFVNNGKPLDELLAKKFKLSRPTVRTLLSTWEKEGRIEMEKDALQGSISKIRILTNFFRRKGTKNKALILLDFENLLINFGGPPRTIVEAINITLKKIAQEVGTISKVFVFVPHQTAQLFGEAFYRAGFIPILCPKIKTKDSQADIDTTDQMLTEVGKELINEMPELTHLCLGSGDIDFASGDIGFPSLIKKANHHGLDIAFIAGDLSSLSSELIRMADRKPDNKEKMIYILPKPEKET